MNGNSQEGIGRSGLYVDMENLQADGQSLLQSLMDHWPEKLPAATRLTLYVRADQTELWRLWATNQFANVEVVVHGTQHFSMSSTKNSADIAIATNAMADLLRERVSHVVIFSDDSDFISLYVAIRNELGISADSDKCALRVGRHKQGGITVSHSATVSSGQASARGGGRIQAAGEKASR